MRNFVKAKQQIKRVKHLLALLLALVHVKKYSKALKVAQFSAMQKKRF